MSRKFTILAFFVSIALWLANSGNPPNGHSGAPGDGLCTDCHTCGTCTQDGSVTLDGLPATITPNAAYVLTLTNSNPNGIGVEAGFQITILNSNNNQAGVLSSPGMFSTIQSQSGRQYWEHNPSQVYPASNMVSWTVTWTAPNGPANTTITAYCAGNIVNGNNATTGDLIVTSTPSGMLDGGGVALMVNINTWNNVLCFGGNTGSATATATGGTPPYAYAWSNGGNTATINNIPAGNYTITVTDNLGATDTDNVTITQPPNLVLQTPSITHVSCNGGNNGSITASATGGLSPYFFSWSTGANGTTINNLSAGNYTVTVTDDNGCTKMATYTVNQPQLIAINLVSLNDESCAGEEDGSITISASGGTNPLFAEWSNGAIGNSITGLEPGLYTVTVTDNNDCTESESYTIDPGGTIDVDLINITHVTCNGGNNGAISVNATGGEAPYTYMWSNGGSGPSITNLAAGSYLLTTTDNNGCELVTLYTINQPAAIVVSIAQAGTILCNGNATVDLTASATNGTPPFSGAWSNGGTGLTLNDVGAGTYTITVTDSGGCSATGSTTVNQPALLTVVVATTDETAVGANDGTATATAGGGTGALTYAWSNGGNTSTITGLAPGLYTVTVTDANGCSVTGSGQVDAFGCNLNVELSGTLAICEGGSGIIQSAVTGGIGTESYLWATGDTTNEITVTEAGEYCLTVTDDAGCQDAACLTVDVLPSPSFTCPVTNESAPGANDGAINCDTIPGVAYAWSNGATTAGISGLSPGIYCLTITDVNSGCTANECFTIQPGNCQLVITSIITDVECNGDATGSVDVNVENATLPITFAWSNGDTDSNLNDVVAGTYSVTIGDAAGCLEIREYIVNQPDPLTVSVDSVRPITDFPGFIQITVSGGNDPYIFLWTNPEGGQNSNEDQDEVHIAGYYTVLVADANGCIVSIDSIFVEMDVSTRPVITYKSMKVYPVPADNMLYIDLHASIEELIMTAIDGRTVLQEKKLQANQVDISHIDAGWYLLRVFDGTQWYIARIIK